METRKNLWAAKPFGEIIKFKYLAAGMKDLPRHPSFVDFRSPLDMDPVLVERLARKAAEYHARTPPKD
jgi:hypothetical protein